MEDHVKQHMMVKTNFGKIGKTWKDLLFFKVCGIWTFHIYFTNLNLYIMHVLTLTEF